MKNLQILIFRGNYLVIYDIMTIILIIVIISLIILIITFYFWNKKNILENKFEENYEIKNYFGLL